MSRFANPQATERMPLGSCQCPGKPHEEDWIEMRTELGAQDVLRFASGNSLDVLGVLVVDWNLLDSDGVRPEVSDETIALLYADTFNLLDEWIEAHVRMGSSLPNGSAVRSRSSSRANGSRPPKATKVA